MNITASIPDDTLLKAGDEINLQALVRPDGSFLVTRVVRREAPKSASEKPRMTPSEWTRMWAGAFTVPSETNLDEVRRDAVRGKFGV